MSTYVITITPDNGVAGADTAHTTVRIDTSTGQTRITELTVRAASGGGLAPADLPPVDLDLLVRALTAPAPAQALPAAEPAPTGGRVSLEPEPTVTAAPTRRRARKVAKKATTAKRAGAKKTAAVKKATAAKATSRRRTSKAQPAASGTRAYRRMPEPDQVMEVYARTGSITGVAEHFDVPRHTVAGWARRLRAMGHSIGR